MVVPLKVFVPVIRFALLTTLQDALKLRRFWRFANDRCHRVWHGLPSRTDERLHARRTIRFSQGVSMSRHRALWKHQWFTCHECGRDIPEPNASQFHNFYHRTRMYCSRECSNRSMSRRFKRPKPVSKRTKRRSARRALWKMQWFTCHECGADIPNPTVNQYKVFRQVGRMYCGKECSRRYCNRLNSSRMSEQNPMRNHATRRRVSRRLKQSGHRPIIQGGKGRGLTKPQQMLLERLGPEWIPEHVIKTGLPKCDGNAMWYSADLAHLLTKTCVEVDGGSHHAYVVRDRDSRRDAILSQLGWRTLRYTNEAILADPDKVAMGIMSTISR